MKICSNCNLTFEEDKKFCKECGSLLTINLLIDYSDYKQKIEKKNNQLEIEYSKLIEIQGFHLGRNQFEKEQQIVEQVRIIKGLKQEITFYDKLINQSF